jgi:transposase-like protein
MVEGCHPPMRVQNQQRINMKSIPTERKASILAKMTGPDRKPIAQLAAEEGLSTATLYNWRKAARTEGQLLPDHDDSPEGWSSRDKFNAVLETAALSESLKWPRKTGQGLKL